MIYKFFDGTELTNDREELNKWKEENSLNSKIDKLLKEHLNTIECKLYNNTDKKILEAFCENLKKNLADR